MAVKALLLSSLLVLKAALCVGQAGRRVGLRLRGRREGNSVDLVLGAEGWNLCAALRAEAVVSCMCSGWLRVEVICKAVLE